MASLKTFQFKQIMYKLFCLMDLFFILHNYQPRTIIKHLPLIGTRLFGSSGFFSGWVGSVCVSCQGNSTTFNSFKQWIFDKLLFYFILKNYFT